MRETVSCGGDRLVIQDVSVVDNVVVKDERLLTGFMRDDRAGY